MCGSAPFVDLGESGQISIASVQCKHGTRIHAARWEMLSQVALCFVICRHQHRCQRHAHWEQPKGSKMMVLPYIQEIFRYMLVAKPDMCTAGNLRDPNNDLPIQKGLQITTSSKKVFDALVDLKCNHDHVHQAIEGSVWLDGQNHLQVAVYRKIPSQVCKVGGQGTCEKKVSDGEASRINSRPSFVASGKPSPPMQMLVPPRDVLRKG